MGALARRNTTESLMVISKESLAGISGVLLMYAGYRHPGTLKARLLLGLTGASLALVSLPSATKEAKALLSR